MATKREASAPPPGLRRCVACGAVGADWVTWPTPAVGVFVAASAPPLIAMGWALWTDPTLLRAALFTVLALGGAGAFLFVERSLGQPGCRYCGGEVFARARLVCPRHGEVEHVVRQAKGWWTILVVPFLVLAFGLAGKRDPEVAHLTGPAFAAALALTGFMLVKTRRPAARCGCEDARPGWTAPERSAGDGGISRAAPARGEEAVGAVQVR